MADLGERLCFGQVGGGLIHPYNCAAAPYGIDDFRQSTASDYDACWS
ncbi:MULTISPECIES: hypothetical protein [Symbiopectobacterium]|nr:MULTISPECIES: hypothetical protein [Symbiopectobacterium]MBT9428384.1 hypothetical protein [Candidatus Symbiopectobacterium endolongispinus]